MDTRRRLERELGQTLGDLAWNTFVATGYVEDFEVTDKPIEWLVERYREIAADFVSRRIPRVAGAERSERDIRGSRQAAVAHLFAIEARGRDDVQQFRSQYLNDGLLEPDGVEEWVQAQVVGQGSPTRFLRVPLDEGTRIRHSRAGVELDPPITVSPLAPFGLSIETLAYVVPDSEWTRHVPTRVGSPLGVLRTLAKGLEREFGWAEAHAVLFVLTDWTPYVASITETVNYRLPSQLATRITLTIDPAATPEEVADRYQTIRRQLMGRRHRRPAPKHSILGSFVAEARGQATWATTMHAWNAKYPEWSYRDLSAFRRDARVARDRLLRPRYSFSMSTD